MDDSYPRFKFAGNIERAVELIRSADELAGAPDYERLRTTLLERGAL